MKALLFALFALSVLTPSFAEENPNLDDPEVRDHILAKSTPTELAYEFLEEKNLTEGFSAERKSFVFISSHKEKLPFRPRPFCVFEGKIRKRVLLHAKLETAYSLLRNLQSQEINELAGLDAIDDSMLSNFRKPIEKPIESHLRLKAMSLLPLMSGEALGTFTSYDKKSGSFEVVIVYRWEMKKEREMRNLLKKKASVATLPKPVDSLQKKTSVSSLRDYFSKNTDRMTDAPLFHKGEDGKIWLLGTSKVGLDVPREGITIKIGRATIGTGRKGGSPLAERHALLSAQAASKFDLLSNLELVLNASARAKAVLTNIDQRPTGDSPHRISSSSIVDGGRKFTTATYQYSNKPQTSGSVPQDVILIEESLGQPKTAKLQLQLVFSKRITDDPQTGYTYVLAVSALDITQCSFSNAMFLKNFVR